MKIIQLTGIFILFAGTITCGNKTGSETASADSATIVQVPPQLIIQDTFETGRIIAHVVCKSDPSQSYALYIPAKREDDTLPVIYFFDPHGDGSLPLTKYKTMADRYGFILIGSNNSKNGNDWATAENIWNILSFDTKKRLRINVNRLYTCGFSGGAKVAGYVALNHPEIKAVIAGGAALPDATAPGNFKFTFTAIAGEGDMNMTDLVAFDAALDKTQTRHRIIFFNGKHEWWPENIMNTACIGLQFDAMRDKLIPKNETIINEYCDSSKRRVNNFLVANDYIKAEAESGLSAGILDRLTPLANDFSRQDLDIKSNAVYQKQWLKRREILATEQRMKNLYSRQFEQADMNYWATTIRDLQAKSTAKTAEGAMNQRLVAYLSLAFYSISNQLINSHRDSDAKYFVELYKLDDATNPEAWYFSAILNARTNDLKAVQNDLLKAVQNGFTDKNRLERQPEFENGKIDLSVITSKMKQH